MSTGASRTATSRSWGASQARSRSESALHRVCGWWPVACSPFLWGCLYLPPGWTPLNHPPRVVSPENTNDLVLLLDTEWTRATVVARDDDDDALQFLWLVPFGAETSIDEGVQDNLWFSNLFLRRSAEFEGELLEVAVQDGEDEVIVRWEITLKEAP